MFNWLKKVFRRDAPASDRVGERLCIEGIAAAPLTAEPDEAEVAAHALLESLREERGSMRGARFNALCAFKWFKGFKRFNALRAFKWFKWFNALRAFKWFKGFKRAAAEQQPTEAGTAEYYRELAERVKEAHEMEARLTLRRIAYCEQELRNPLLNAEQLAELERGLYRHMDAVDREGGELKKHWQHVLAEVVVRSPTLALPSREGDRTAIVSQ